MEYIVSIICCITQYFAYLHFIWGWGFNVFVFKVNNLTIVDSMENGTMYLSGVIYIPIGGDVKLAFLRSSCDLYDGLRLIANFKLYKIKKPHILLGLQLHRSTIIQNEDEVR